MMTPDDLVITDLKGKRSRAPRAFLRTGDAPADLPPAPDVHAVCHAHPPTATGYAAAGIPLNKAILSEVVLLARLHSRGAATARRARRNFPTRSSRWCRTIDAILLANHGVVTCGQDLLTAFFRMETVEHFAQVSLVTELLGKQVLLSGRDVEKLLAARARYGTTTASR